jgi:hypothetical protein
MSDTSLSDRQVKLLAVVAEGGGDWDARWIDLTVNSRYGPGEGTVLRELEALQRLGLVVRDDSRSVERDRRRPIVHPIAASTDRQRYQPPDNPIDGIHYTPPSTSENSAVSSHGLFGAVGPRTPKSVESPQIGYRLNTPFRCVRVAAWTRELAGNLPHAPCSNRPFADFNTLAAGPDGARIPAARPALLPAGRQP